VVGRALKLQGQPQSQLHATRTFPLRRQLFATSHSDHPDDRLPAPCQGISSWE
jgi:hypothetical protein